MYDLSELFRISFLKTIIVIDVELGFLIGTSTINISFKSIEEKMYSFEFDVKMLSKIVRNKYLQNLTINCDGSYHLEILNGNIIFMYKKQVLRKFKLNKKQYFIFNKFLEHCLLQID